MALVSNAVMVDVLVAVAVDVAVAVAVAVVVAVAVAVIVAVAVAVVVVVAVAVGVSVPPIHSAAAGVGVLPPRATAMTAIAPNRSAAGMAIE
jgi:hypothetical protein